MCCGACAHNACTHDHRLPPTQFRVPVLCAMHSRLSEYHANVFLDFTHSGRHNSDVHVGYPRERCTFVSDVPVSRGSPATPRTPGHNHSEAAAGNTAAQHRRLRPGHMVQTPMSMHKRVDALTPRHRCRRLSVRHLKTTAHSMDLPTASAPGMSMPAIACHPLLSAPSLRPLDSMPCVPQQHGHCNHLHSTATHICTCSNATSQQRRVDPPLHHGHVHVSACITWPPTLRQRSQSRSTTAAAGTTSHSPSVNQVSPGSTPRGCRAGAAESPAPSQNIAVAGVKPGAHSNRIRTEIQSRVLHG